MIETTITEPAAAGDLPDGVNAPEGVLAFARLAGFEGAFLPSVVIFDETYFSETTAFIKTSDGGGYYRTTLTTCTCPSFRYRGGPCKHQRALAERLERRARIDARNKAIRDEREARVARPPSTRRGFNPPESLAVAPL